jgi:pseudouridine-5'-phosphate glycosidase
MIGGARRMMDVSPEVADALARGLPVVALESGVFSHGLPPDAATATARHLDAVVREEGAVPALVAVRGGRILIGADARAIDFLFDPGIVKVAERDLAVVAAQRRSGGTTVSATAAVAVAVGIRVMATGGIGGVHLGAEESADVSSDLDALARYPVVAVCAGAKAICDQARTAELLETLGVTVVGYRTNTMPAFYAVSSGLPVPHRVETVAEIAAIAGIKRNLGDRAALLVVQPVPQEAALDGGVVDEAVRAALEQARRAGVRGGAVTPFLLSAIAAATGGRALTANLALLEANAGLGASVAVAVHTVTEPKR